MSLQTVYNEGRLIRGAWSMTAEDGRQLLCLYTALAGDAEARPATCPADLCPAWLAHLLPWLDDAGSAAAWPDVVRRVVALSPSFGCLSPDVEYHVRALCVREAMHHTTDITVLAVCESVAMLCERAGRGDMAQLAEWAAAEVVAASETASEAARAAAWAAAGAARAAVRAAADAARAAWAETAAARADRLMDQILTCIEQALEVTHGGLGPRWR
jgi:hypothetical protein